MSESCDRRSFIRQSALTTAGLYLLGTQSALAASPPPGNEQPFVIGPMEGYSPQVGTLVSMLNYNRKTIIDAVKKLTMAELDHLHDPKANTIGALVLHLGATEKFYQVNTFEERQEFNETEQKAWGAAMNLGEEGRKNIRGREIGYYLDTISEVRTRTLAELRNRDDKWLMAVDPKWSRETPLNTYWKWFHVCEHESNHRGQITWLKKRLPGAKDEEE